KTGFGQIFLAQSLGNFIRLGTRQANDTYTATSWGSCNRSNRSSVEHNIHLEKNLKIQQKKSAQDYHLKRIYSAHQYNLVDWCCLIAFSTVFGNRLVDQCLLQDRDQVVHNPVQHQT